MAKAMDVFRLDHARWAELAADRGAWRAMLQSGEAPPGFRQAPAPAVPMPISHYSVRPRRAAAAATNRAIRASLAVYNNNIYKAPLRARRHHVMLPPPLHPLSGP